MTICPTDDVITSDVTPHSATRCPGGWAVTWLGDRTVDYSQAITAMFIAEIVADPSSLSHPSGFTADDVIRSFMAELELGMTLNEVKRLVAETLPPAPVHDTHAIPADDEPEPATAVEISPGDMFRDADSDEWVAVTTGHETFLAFPDVLYATKHVVEKWGPLVKYLSDDEPISAVEQVKSCPSCSHCGKTFHVDDAPAKTHDLSIRKTRGGNVSIAVEGEGDEVQVYLLDGTAHDLGRVLAVLTPAQRQLLVDDLTGGEG